MIPDDLITLTFHDRTIDAHAAARQVPRCDSCRHHPNAHAKGSCGVIVERPGNREAKCGCTAAKKTETGRAA
jgi:hypothetical protein